MAYSTQSFAMRDTNDTSKNYAIAANDSSYKGTNNLSWQFWCAFLPGTNKNILSAWEDTASNHRMWLFSNQDDGTFRIIFSWDGSNFSLHKTASAIFDNSWKHIVVTFASGTFTCYVNGVSQTLNETIAWGGGVAGLHNGSQRVLMGSQNPASPVEDKTPGGCLNNVAMFNVALNSTQITELYNGGAPATPSGYSTWANVTNWWRFDQTDNATTITDIKNGSGSNMTIVKSGTTQYLQQSGNYPTRSTDPGAGNVSNGTTYVFNGDNKTGTLVGGKGHLGQGNIG